MWLFKKKSYEEKVKELEAQRKKAAIQLQKEQKVAKLKTDIAKISAAKKRAIQRQYPVSTAIVKGVGKAAMNIGKPQVYTKEQIKSKLASQKKAQQHMDMLMRL